MSEEGVTLVSWASERIFQSFSFLLIPMVRLNHIYGSFHLYNFMTLWFDISGQTYHLTFISFPRPPIIVHLLLWLVSLNCYSTHPSLFLSLGGGHISFLQAYNPRSLDPCDNSPSTLGIYHYHPSSSGLRIEKIGVKNLGFLHPSVIIFPPYYCQNSGASHVNIKTSHLQTILPEKSILNRNYECLFL